MSKRKLYCEQCGKEAKVFTIEPPLKKKACQEHAIALMGDKHPSLFNIAAYDFIEKAEDYAEYAVRRDIAQKCQGTLTVLQERCETNRIEAHSRLNSVQEALIAMVDRSVQEVQIQVEQRYQQVKEELAALGVALNKFTSNKQASLTPTLEAMSKSVPVGALFRVCVGDCSL